MSMLFQVGKYKNKCLTKQETKLTNNYINIYILKAWNLNKFVFWNYSKKTSANLKNLILSNLLIFNYFKHLQHNLLTQYIY